MKKSKIMLSFILCIPLIFCSLFFSACGQSAEKKANKELLSIGSFYQKDYKKSSLVFNDDGTYDFTSPEGISITNKTWEYDSSGSYSYSGNWGYKGTVQYHIFKLNDYSEAFPQSTKAFYGWFVLEDGFYYMYSGEYAPSLDDIKNGLIGSRWFAVESNN